MKNLFYISENLDEIFLGNIAAEEEKEIFLEAHEKLTEFSARLFSFPLGRMNYVLADNEMHIYLNNKIRGKVK